MADLGNSCVKVYTSDGKDDGKFIQQLRKDDRMHGPWGVAVDSTGVVYVTENGSNCVSMFKDGTYVDSFGSKGKGEKDFNQPTDVAISGGNMSVTNNNYQVKVLSPLDHENCSKC